MKKTMNSTFSQFADIEKQKAETQGKFFEDFVKQMEANATKESLTEQLNTLKQQSYDVNIQLIRSGEGDMKNKLQDLLNSITNEIEALKSKLDQM